MASVCEYNEPLYEETLRNVTEAHLSIDGNHQWHVGGDMFGQLANLTKFLEIRLFSPLDQGLLALLNENSVMANDF